VTVPGAVHQLPTSRSLVQVSLELGTEAARRLRGASIYVAMISLGLVGPLVVALIVLMSRYPDLVFLDSFLDPTVDPSAPPGYDPEAAVAAMWISLGVLVAVVGMIAMAVESQAMGAAILAGVAIGRPVSTLEALRRSRQVFWRLVGYALLTVVPISIVTQVLATILFLLVGEAYETVSLVTTVCAAILGLPFVYGVTSIVLGEVGVVEAARRSIRLTRARWRLAIVITLVATVAWYIATFAYLGAIGLVTTIGSPLGIGFDNGPLALVVLIGLALALSAAFGSLLLTVTAIVMAPQVIAFLGLTHYSGGIDRGRDETVLRPPVRYLTIPMAIAIGAVIVCSIGAIASS